MTEHGSSFMTVPTVSWLSSN